jgi:hypothetical protein
VIRSIDLVAVLFRPSFGLLALGQATASHPGPGVRLSKTIGNGSRAMWRSRIRRISLRLLPVWILRGAQSRVRGSCIMRTWAIIQRAAFADRSPPRLRRLRVVLPDEASMGQAPQSAAKAASLLSRPGLSRRDEELSGREDPDPGTKKEFRAPLRRRSL